MESDIATGFVTPKAVRSVSTQTTESYLNRTNPGIYIGELSAFGASVVGVDPGVTLVLGWGPGEAIERVIQGPDDLPDSFYGGPDTRLKNAVNQFFASGGTSLEVIRVPSASPSDLIAGLGLFELGPRMVVLPDLPYLTQSDADLVLKELAELVVEENLLAILELPSGLAQPSQVQAWIQARPEFQIEQFSFFWPSPVGSNGLAPSLAGAFARSAEENGVDQPPVGVQNALSGIGALSYALNQEEISSLGTAGINPMAMHQDLAVCYGDTTASIARTIDQRRSLDYLEMSIKLALQSFVFAANDGTTWNTVVVMTSSFLQDFWLSGGLHGATASDAFSVSCGVPATMTGPDVLNGYMIMEATVNLNTGTSIELTFTQTMGS